MQKFTDTMLFGHCIFYVRCWQCLETGKVSLYLWVTKSKRRKIIWCVCIFSCSFLVAQNSLTTQLPTVSVRLQIYFCSGMWACIFRVTWWTVGMHNAMAQIDLETNSLGDRFIRKGKKLHCYNYLIYICYHAGGSPKHFRRSKVKRCDEESSPGNALTPKKRKTRLAGKMRTYLWACPLTANPQPHLPFPWFCKIKMCLSSKMAWIDAVRSTRYPFILILCCDVFMCLVKQGIPSDEDLEWLFIRKKLHCYNESVG